MWAFLLLTTYWCFTLPFSTQFLQNMQQCHSQSSSWKYSVGSLQFRSLADERLPIFHFRQSGFACLIGNRMLDTFWCSSVVRFVVPASDFRIYVILSVPLIIIHFIVSIPFLTSNILFIHFLSVNLETWFPSQKSLLLLPAYFLFTTDCETNGFEGYAEIMAIIPQEHRNRFARIQSPV